MKTWLVLIFLSSSLLLQSAFAENKELKVRLEKILQKTGVGAATFTIVEGDKIIATAGMGHYSLTDNRAVTADSLFRIGSITKTFTALATMVLVEQKKLQLNQPIHSLIPEVEFKNPWKNTTPVTIAMLLEHTSGLGELSQKEFNYPFPLPLKKALQVAPEKHQVKFQPGYHTSYTNAGAGYIGRAIEIITHQNYDNWFQKKILDKLKMHDSSIKWSKQLQKELVTGYDSDLKTRIPYWHTLYRPFGGLNTSANDMAKFLLLFTRKKQMKSAVISNASITRMETPTTSLAAKTGLKIGYGLGLHTQYFRGHKIYGHSGDADGYLSDFAYSKENHRGYFIVINAFRDDLLQEFVRPLDDWLLENLTRPGINKSSVQTYKMSSEKIRNVVGKYHRINYRFPTRKRITKSQMTVNYKNNQFQICNAYQRCRRIIAMTEQLFREVDEPQASIAIIKTPEGCQFLETGFESYRKQGNDCE